MNVLLMSMPDSFEHMPAQAVRMPNGALTSLAGNVDAHHRVAVADLILVQDSVEATVRRLMSEWEPDVVGLSIMTFQRVTAFAVMDLVRSLKPGARIVVGGYDPSLAKEVYGDSQTDFLVAGEGEITFRELLRAIERGEGFEDVAGLSHRVDGRLQHNRKRSIAELKGEEIRLPNRAARVLEGYSVNGRKADVVETSRGCTFDCSFCSIIEMRGRNFHRFSIPRVIADIADARARGAQSIFLVDDNIVLDVRRFTALCQAIIDAGLSGIDYTLQAMTSTMADHGATLAPLMRRAGFRYVFLGIENVLQQDLGFLKAESKNTKRVDGKRSGNAAIDAIRHIRRHGMFVVGGLIVGNPGDTRADIEANLDFARRWVDWPYIQHPTPYPGTPMTTDLRQQGLIAITDVAQYDGTTAVVRCEHLDLREIEFLRWRAERWMKVRHMPAMVRHDPLFSLRRGVALLAHTFRGSTIWSVLGLGDERKAFERYCAKRTAERNYIGPIARSSRARPLPVAQVSAIAFATVLAGQSGARADWEFTHWGMTPEQVVSASGSTAHLIAPAARYQDEMAHWEMAAEGDIRDGTLTLHGGYMFDTRGGGLTCVMYNATGDDVGKLRGSLIARYGRPIKDSVSGPLEDITWHTPDNLELVINQKPLAAAVTHCAPGR